MYIFKGILIGEDGMLHLALPNCRNLRVEVQIIPLCPNDELELIAQINHPLPLETRKRYDTLMAKRRAEILTPAEYTELQELTDSAEADNLRRWENLALLAEHQKERLDRVAGNFGFLHADTRIHDPLMYEVMIRARYKCEYCGSHAAFYPNAFSVEPILPLSQGGETVSDNLAFACFGCSNAKYNFTTGIDPVTQQEVPLHNPRHYPWTQDLSWSQESKEVIGLTPTSRATMERLRFYRHKESAPRWSLLMPGIIPSSNW